MSDIREEPGAVTPPATGGPTPPDLETEQASDEGAPPATDRTVDVSLPSNPLPTSAVFSSGFESPGEVPPEASRPVSPYVRDLGTPSKESDELRRHPIAAYRPTPPIERAVRPLEPSMSEAPTAETTDTPVRRAEPRLPYYAARSESASPPPRKQWPLALLAVASGLLGALLVLGGLALGGIFDEDAAPPTTTVAPVAATAPPQTVIVREVVTEPESQGIATAVGQKVVPSIVTVEIGTGSATDDPFAAFGSGSGVVFSEDGLILTNHHVVVVDGAETSRVIFQDGRIYEATIIGSDELTDLAVLRIDATGLVPIELGATESLRIGDRAIAVGNPLGLRGGASLTVGVVSAFDREVNTGDDTPLFGMLQTDAPITNGSSGGALVDAAGRLIGITTAIGVSQAGAEGIGFATPVEVVRRIADQIIETGDVAHAFLGVQLRTNFEIQPDGSAFPTGAHVTAFAEGPSAAEEAGLEVDDVIVAWNDNEVRTMNDLINGIRRAEVGETITLDVRRGSEFLSISVMLGERPEGV